MVWLSDPIVWLLLLPALAATGVSVQMVLGLFTCCGTFRLRGKSIPLRWWSIPLGAVVTVLLWALVVLYTVLTL